ncbi:Alpha/Beta hydrolase protein [Neohortaea acidophila]|uniref:Alpha/Beta hydrolase protein n=1 Tax=Neohortaea acidophila TaxID=245834 RepID=A0A6A6Q7X9_9PEZI|nr:Alpha/Beta hydrolase protein [Neohortaea acidophila]KAF2488046.1 Alpha/Beta hydrolase protein [Neohortaea acidophila]
MSAKPLSAHHFWLLLQRCSPSLQRPWAPGLLLRVPQTKPMDYFEKISRERIGMVSFFMKQNELIENGTISHRGAHYLHLDTLGIVNGCIDSESQTLSYATFPHNNTYGLQALNESQYHSAMYEMTRPGGIADMIKECHRLQRKLDPGDHGDSKRVADYCRMVGATIEEKMNQPYRQTGASGWYDITHPSQDPFPPMYGAGFLNQHWVQRALGTPVNHTMGSSSVGEGFGMTGDMSRGGQLEDIGYILDHGVRVALMYGDRDYACNWVGGEAASLSVPYAHQDDFASAGYIPLVISPVHSGGLTRQFGNFSFTRVYQAGHMVPSYQPEVAYEIFMRAITGRDIATGKVSLEEVAAHGEQYSSKGTPDAWWMKSEILPSPPSECYLFDTGRCSEEELKWIQDGTAIVKDWIVVGREPAKDLEWAAGEFHQQVLGT